MKKSLVAVAVLVLAGVAVAGAVHVRNSLCDGVCPLTGRPIHGSAPASVACPATPDCPYEDDRCLESKRPAAAAVDAGAASDESKSPCCRVKRHCCDDKQDCEKKQAQAEQKPVVPATENP